MTSDERSRRVARTGEAYRLYAEAYASKADDRAWLRKPIAGLVALLAPGALVVDVGCGPGRETVELRDAGFRVLGLDINSSLLRLARRDHPESGYVQGDFLHLPIGDEAVDGAWSASALVHLAPDETEAGLAEIFRILRRGGGFYCSMQLGSQAGFVGSRPSDSVQAERYYAFWDPSAFRERLQAAGFEIVIYDVQQLDEVAQESACNVGATGWINATVRRP